MGQAAHNISNDDQYKAFQLAKVKRLKETADSATASYASGLGKLESNGMDKWAVKEALKIQKKGSAEVSDYVAKLKKLFQYLSYLNLPVDESQLQLFPTSSSEEPLIEKAFRFGVLTGAMGEGMDQNPHAPDTEAGQSWIKGYHEGTKNFHDFKAEDAEEEQAEFIPGDQDDEDQSDIEDEE